MLVKTWKAMPSWHCAIFSRRGISHALLAAWILIYTTHPALAQPDAADPDAPSAPATYRPVIDGYVPFRPVEPRDWRRVNREVAPEPKKDSKDRNEQH